MATNGIDCYVKLPTGKTMSFILKHDDSVCIVYSKVSEELNVSTDRVVIKYTGKVVNREHTVGYLGICKETILKAEVIQIEKLSIIVKLEGGKTLPMTIDNISPVRCIKEHIASVEGIEISKQILELGRATLSNNNQKCMDVGIADEAVLSLRIQQPKPDNEDNVELALDEQEAVLGSFDAGGRTVEVVFSFDTTGSMYSCLEQVRSRLKATVGRLVREVPGVRIGLIAHGDYLDYGTYVVKTLDFTSDVDALQQFVEEAPKTMGGGDGGECYEWVLRLAQRLDWSEHSAKALVMIGDDVPHVVSFTDQRINWHDELDVLTGLGVKVYGVRAEHGTAAAEFYKELAARTGGAYITFANFSIIAQMFLAVCYKQASQQQFEDFQAEVTAEVAQGSKVAEDVSEMLQQIEKSEQTPPADAAAENRVYVAKPWWDPQLDQGSPQYTYDAETEQWARIMRHSSPAHVSHPTAVVSTDSYHSQSGSRKSRFSFRRKSKRTLTATAAEKKKGCVLM